MPSGSSAEVSSLRGGSPRVSPCPFWTKPIPHVGWHHMTTMQTGVRVPPHTHLCSPGFAGGVSVTALRSRFTVLRIRRDRGDRASPLHLGERHCTSTGPKLSKTSSVHVPHPWRMHHCEGTDRSFAMYAVFPHSDYYALLDCLEGFGVSLGSRLPTLHPPSHPFQALPCSQHRTQNRML
jgi:hypothetical protein